MKRKFGHARETVATLSADRSKTRPAGPSQQAMPLLPHSRKPAHIWRRGAARIPTGRKGAA
jgi:hypothetical protein